MKYNLIFVCVADDETDKQVKTDELKRDKSKDQGEELVEVNFATKDGES